MKNKGKLLIIDGHNLLFQMFFGMPNKIINKDGIAIQGVIGFVGAFLKIINKVNPTHLVVLFDSEHKNERNELLETYKANRIDYSTVDEIDNPFSQLQYIYNALEYMNIKYHEVKKYETDDVIASYVFKYQNDYEIIISSYDSDFFQLINNNVKVLRYKGDNTIICDEEYIKNKLNINPCLYADFKALTGDTADNIKGVEKIGKVTASTLINMYGPIEKIIENIDTFNKISVIKSIKNNIEKIHLNYKLIKLNNRDEIPFTIDELNISIKENKTTNVLVGIGLK